MNPRIVLVLGIVIGLFAVINHFPPYDFIVCLLSGLLIGRSIRRIHDEKIN